MWRNTSRKLYFHLRRRTKINSLRNMFKPKKMYLARRTYLKKGQGHVAVNKPVISIIYTVAHTWQLCSAQILVDGVNPKEIYFQKSTNIYAIVRHDCFVWILCKVQESIFKLTPSFWEKWWKISVICPIKNTAKSSFRKKFVYIWWLGPFNFGDSGRGHKGGRKGLLGRGLIHKIKRQGYDW